MPFELTNELLIVASIACAAGLIITAIIFSIGQSSRAGKQDPRDARIRSLEADLRVAQADSADKRNEAERLENKLKETSVGMERRDEVITEQKNKLQRVTAELKESVVTTAQLRAELAQRADEGLHAAAKIREVEAELSVAQASNDMIATGALDYELSPKKPASAAGSGAEDKATGLARKTSR